jgi:uncharacterized protein
MINLETEHLMIVKSILQKLIPETTVWVFGSRITHQVKTYSDLDLVIIGEKKIPQTTYYQLQDAMEESSLPFKVDVLDWHRITPSFRKIIQQQHEILTF